MKRYLDKVVEKVITEKQLIQMESELEKMGWIREACGNWEDPFTGLHHPTSKSYSFAMQRRKSKINIFK